MGKKPQMWAELNEKLEYYLRQEEGEAVKQAYLNAMTSPTTRHYHQSSHHPESQGVNRHFRHPRRSQGRFKPFPRDKRRGQRSDIYVIADRHAGKGDKGRYYENHKRKTCDSVNCSVLKHKMEEKQLKGNFIEIAWGLRTKFVAENTKDGAKVND